MLFARNKIPVSSECNSVVEYRSYEPRVPGSIPGIRIFNIPDGNIKNVNINYRVNDFLYFSARETNRSVHCHITILSSLSSCGDFHILLKELP